MKVGQLGEKRDIQTIRLYLVRDLDFILSPTYWFIGQGLREALHERNLHLNLEARRDIKLNVSQKR